MRTGILIHIRRNLLRGLFLVLPMLITLWLLGILFRILDANVTPWVRQVLIWANIPGLERWFAQLGIPVIGLLLTAAFIYFLGLLVASLGGRRLVGMVESYIRRIPAVGGVYGSARQLLDAVAFQDRRHFTRVVLVEYPREGLWTVGFVTREARHEIKGRDRSNHSKAVPVFLPTTPNPTSGWMVLVPEEALINVAMSIDEGLKLVVSGGIVSPEDLGPLSSSATLPEAQAPPTSGEPDSDGPQVVAGAPSGKPSRR